FSMGLDGAQVVKATIAIVGAISTLAVFSLGKCVFTPRVGLWAAAFFYTTPLVSWLTGTAHTDLILVLFVTSAAIAFLNWIASYDVQWVLATSLLLGAGVAVKLNAMYAAIGFGIALTIMLFGSTPTIPNRARTIAILVLPAALVALPWYFMTYIHTGNPVF